MGISAQPTLPPVGGYTRDDLERLRYQLLRSGEDPAMMGRVAEVIGMRPADEPRVGYDDGAAPKSQGMGNYRETQLQQQIGRITGARQQLLDALTPKR
jgi:hypothetical protein